MTVTPYSAHFDDIYFAAEGGLAESRYVFLDRNRLPDGWQGRSRFTICETGFGTGLNFLCAWTLFEETTGPQQKLHYYSFEKFPLSANEISTYLEQWSGEFGGRLERLCANYPLRIGGWHTLHLTDRVTLTIIFDDMNRALPELDARVDCWFLDGHAPAKNPDMWSETLFQNMGRLSQNGARVATFTAAGIVRRGLGSAGFAVAKDRGFGRKRDMTVGVFEGKGIPQKDLTVPHKIAIIGGGIAGASCAASLQRYRKEVHLFEKNGIASGGSGNFRGLFNPRLTKLRGAESDFYSPAFARAVRFFGRQDDVGFSACGSLHLVTDEDKAKRFQGMAENWGWHADHARYVTADEASRVAGIELRHDALFLPDAGMVCPLKVTEKLAQTASIHRMEVTTLARTAEGWQVNDDEYEAVIFAGGKDIARFKETTFCPVQAVRGQISYIRTPQSLKALKTNLCYGGYTTPDVEGRTVVGSTFQHWLHDESLRDEDHQDVIKKLGEVVSFSVDEIEILGGRASFRCASKDRVPIIGSIPETHGLYISAAHGSHGLLSAQMAADILVADMMGEPQILPRSVLKHISPARFRMS